MRTNRHIAVILRISSVLSVVQAHAQLAPSRIILLTDTSAIYKVPVLAGNSSGGHISRRLLGVQSGIYPCCRFVVNENDTVRGEVKSFTFHHRRNGKEIFREALKGPFFTRTLKESILHAEKGDIFTIGNIIIGSGALPAISRFKLVADSLVFLNTAENDPVFDAQSLKAIDSISNLGPIRRLGSYYGSHANIDAVFSGNGPYYEQNNTIVAMEFHFGQHSGIRHKWKFMFSRQTGIITVEDLRTKQKMSLRQWHELAATVQ
jgi:hypothetical protein